MTRNRKIENEVKTTGMNEFKPVGSDMTKYTLDEILATYTNHGSDRFCPYLDHMRLAKTLSKLNTDSGMMHRDSPLSAAYSLANSLTYDIKNMKNRHYHWVQIGFHSYQYCTHSRDPVQIEGDEWEKCLCKFSKCSIYKAHQKE